MREYVVREYDMEDYDAYYDGLTKEDVLDGLRQIKRGWLPDYNYTGTEDDYCNFRNHAIINKAIMFLERIEDDED